MTVFHRRTLLGAFAAAALTTSAPAVLAQGDWPSHQPVTIIMTFNAGSAWMWWRA
jgi:tripartite-type tricarboxylate transporter receptor subunit TctC